MSDAVEEALREVVMALDSELCGEIDSGDHPVNFKVARDIFLSRLRSLGADVYVPVKERDMDW